jgi:hypothetical protein
MAKIVLVEKAKSTKQQNRERERMTKTYKYEICFFLLFLKFCGSFG